MKKTLETGFSDLPEEVSCEILGYLDILDLARASTLSKEFHKLCTLVPRLRISSATREGDRDKIRRYLELLRSYSEKVSQQRSLVRYIELQWTFSTRDADEDRQYLETWLSEVAAASDNIKEIRILVSTEFYCGRFKLKPCVLQQCRTLEKLILSGADSINITFPPTSTTKFDGLRILNLNNVRVMEKDLFLKWLSESCRNLEELVLEHVRGVEDLRIVIPSLQTLIIQGFRFQNITVVSESLKTLKLHNWSSEFIPRTKSLSISAPNLNYLVLEGKLADNYCLNKFKFLQVASLHYFQDFPKEVIVPSINKLLESVGEAKTLRVDGRFLKVLEDNKKLQLVGVQDLFVDARTEYYQTMASYLGRFPNLQCLSIRSFSERSAVDIEFKRFDRHLKSQELDFTHQVIKTLRIRLHREDMVKLGSFVKYLLECAALHEIITYYSPQEFLQPSEIAKEFIDNQQNCPTRLILEPTSYMSIPDIYFRIKK